MNRSGEPAKVNLDDELVEIARLNDAATQASLDSLTVEPALLLRHLRYYLSRQSDYRRITRLKERAVELTQVEGGAQELEGSAIEFSSGSALAFRIRLEQGRTGWAVKQFRFHVKLAQPRCVKMVRIHLNRATARDPLAVPLCHLHIDSSRPHIPFPIVNPRLVLHLVCQHLEPDIGQDTQP
jgi:hypothetical protein